MICANDRCAIEFEPLVRNQKFHAVACRKRQFDRVQRPTHRGKKITLPYMDRAFNAFDGEGESPDGEGSDRLTLLADSDGRELFHDDRRRLTSVECLDWLLDAPRGRANVWYSFGYDVVNILRDLPRKHVQQLMTNNRVWWRRYRIEYIPSKLFSVSKRDCNCRRGSRRNERCEHYRSYTAHDVYGFFQKSFLGTMEERNGFYRSKAPHVIDIIERGKAARGMFDRWAMQDVVKYNRAELEVLLEIMENFRDALRVAGYTVKAWNGAGALASDWMRREHVTTFYNLLPDAMHDARDRAFFGGRIDSAVIGEGVMSEGDVQSAYPAGICTLPNMKRLRWKLTKGYPKRDDLGLFHCRWNVPADTWWGPFPFREPDDTIKFPLEGEGWYYASEAKAAIARFGDAIEVIEAWEASGKREYPFAVPVQRDYELRATYKHMDPPHPANVPLKLGLNSIYGKFAQRVGVKMLPDGTIKTPRLHNLFYAGMITAWARSRLSEAIFAHGDRNVLMIATDGVFVRGKWKLIERDALGSFEIDAKTYRAVIAGPGMYQTEQKDGKLHKNKRRGFGGGSIDYRDVIRRWRRHEKVEHPVRRMVTLGQAAVSQDAYDRMGCFFDSKREMKPLSGNPFASKRFRNPYSPTYVGKFETLAPGVRISQECSAPYKLLRKRDLRTDDNG